MEEKQVMKAHKLVMNNRKTSVMTGILDVLAFDLNEILLETEQGMLVIKGKDLHVNRLSLEKGEVDVTGHIDSCTYSDIQATKKKDENFFVKLFKLWELQKRLVFIFLRFVQGFSCAAYMEPCVFLGGLSRIHCFGFQSKI